MKTNEYTSRLFCIDSNERYYFGYVDEHIGCTYVFPFTVSTLKGLFDDSEPFPLYFVGFLRDAYSARKNGLLTSTLSYTRNTACRLVRFIKESAPARFASFSDFMDFI